MQVNALLGGGGGDSIKTAKEVLMAGVSSDGLSSYVAGLYVPQDTQVNSLTCLQSGSMATNVGGCTFIPNSGFNMIPGAYIDTGRPPGPGLVAVASHLWVYLLQHNAPSGQNDFLINGDDPGNVAFSLFSSSSGLASQAHIGNFFCVPSISFGTPYTGFVCASRISSLDITIRVGGQTNSNTNDNLGYNLLSTVYTIKVGNDFNGRIAAWGWGGGLTQSQVVMLQSRIQTYLTAIGAI